MRGYIGQTAHNTTKEEITMENGQSSMIYLNNAATSWPKPPGVLEEIKKSLASPVSGSGRSSGSRGEDYPALARKKLSALLGAEPKENIIFTQNATDSLNILISGFVRETKGPFHVITTALEHNSVLRPLCELRDEGRITLTIVPFENAKVSKEAVSGAIQADTKLAVISHGSNVLGSVQDIAGIGEILREKEIFFIVDGAQTAGHIPVDLKSLPVDAFVFTGHKGLLGVAGTGGFFIKNPKKVAPLKFGGTGTGSCILIHPRDMPERFEAGTCNYPGIAGLYAGVSFISSTGMDKIHEKGLRQTGYIISELRRISGLKIHNETPEIPVISFSIKGIDSDDVGEILGEKYGIICRTGLHCAPLVHEKVTGGKGCVRLSLSWFTTDEECRIAVRAIREIAENADGAVSQA